MSTRTLRVMRVSAVAAFSLASVFAGSAVAMASPSSRVVSHATVEVKGTITLLTPTSGTPTSITVQPLNPAKPSENILLGSATVYRQSGQVVTVAALAVGEPVDVTLAGAPATAAVVHILTPQPIIIGGTVTALTPSTGTPTSMTVQPNNAKKPSVNIDLSSSTLYYLGGASSSVSALAVGSQVLLMATGSPATATVVEIALPKPVHIEGTVTAVNPSSGAPTDFVVLPTGKNTLAVDVALSATTVFRQAGQTVTVADLMVGSKVNVTASGNPLTATTVAIAVPHPVQVNGTVIALNPSSGTPTSMEVQPAGLKSTPLTIALSSTTVYTQLKATVTIDALLVGSHVSVSATGNPLTATKVWIAAPPADVTIGSVTAVTSTSVTVQPLATGSSPITFTLTNTTSYYSGRRVATIDALNVGDLVRIAAAASAPTTAVNVTVKQMVVVGRVTSVSGDVITVTGLYGAILTVNTDTTTVFRERGTASSLTAVLPGDLIAAIGPAVSGVTNSVNAAEVWIGVSHNTIYHNAWIQYRYAGKRHHH